MMSLDTVHHLRTQRRDLLNQLDEMEEPTSAMVAPSATDMAEDDEGDLQARLAWLERQRIGVMVLLNETERKLLSLDSAPEWQDD